MSAPRSTLADAITALVAEKRAVGYKYAAEERVLARFEAFCAQRVPRTGHGHPRRRSRRGSPRPGGGGSSPRPCRAWPRRSGSSPAGSAAVASTAYVLPAGALPRPARYVPHIYTDRELAALFAPDRPLPLLLGGPVPASGDAGPVPHDLRVRAALLRGPAAARRATSTSTAGVLQIRDAKGGKDRQLPVSEPLREQARRLPRQARRAARLGVVLPRRDARPAVDAGERLPQLPPVPVAGPHLRTAAADTAPVSMTCATRWRVNNLRSWFARGEDVNALLPVLQTYLGHSSIGDTAYYLQPDRGVLPATSPPASKPGVRRRRPARSPEGRSWRLTSRSACAAS